MKSGSSSLARRGLYWSLAVAVGVLVSTDADAQSKGKAHPAKPKPAPVASVAQDPLTEWELLNGAAIELRQKIAKSPRDDALRQQMADLAIRSAVGAERALAIGDASLFDSYRRQFGEQFHDTRWRIGRLAAQGNAAAEYAAGVLALHGYQKPVNVEAACRHFGAALDKGYLGAKFRASRCLEKTDPARAETLLLEAAASGHPVAAELAGRACLEAKPPDAECAWDRLTVAAAAGRPSAQSVLAWMHTQGAGGRPPDPARAARLYLQAAKAGDAAAQNNVGELFETGRGLPMDPKQAVDWYRKAADGGFAPAQFNLGRLYAAGTGVEKDFAEARKWLELAERGGVATARKLLDWMDKNSAAK
jgi:TPR repeat protein